MMRLDHPLWSCGLRPFFLFASVTAALLMVAWGLFLAGGLPLPAVPGGAIVWHAHELLFGFACAAMAGFLLTVMPSFAGGDDFSARSVRWLAVLWLLGRVAFWASGWFGTPALVLAALAHLMLLGALLCIIAPRLLLDPQRGHLAFLWLLAGLVVCVAGFYFDALAGEHPARWLLATLGIFMMLIVVALSRISLRIVNHAMRQAGIVGVDYRAGLLRRKLALAAIALYTTAEFFVPGTRLSGWLALGVATSVVNLMGDWRIGRALLLRLPLMLFGVYLFMALGYAAIGLALVLDGVAVNAGRHLLTVGALGLAIFAVMGIAGRAHCGTPFETRLWQPIGAWLLAATALTRALSDWPGAPTQLMLGAAAALWTLAWLLFVVHMAPLFLRPRADGLHGCRGTAIP